MKCKKVSFLLRTHKGDFFFDFFDFFVIFQKIHAVLSPFFMFFYVFEKKVASKKRGKNSGILGKLKFLLKREGFTFLRVKNPWNTAENFFSVFSIFDPFLRVFTPFFPKWGSIFVKNDVFSENFPLGISLKSLKIPRFFTVFSCFCV